MKQISEKLLLELEQQLQGIHAENPEPIQYAEKAIKAAVVVLEKLKTHFLAYHFDSKREEIDFFRNSKPELVAKLIYYNEVYTLASNRPAGNDKAVRRYYKNELGKLEAYFNENAAFYRYYRTGNTSLDKSYFLRGRHDLKQTLDSFYFQADQRFSTSHDYKVAKILANDSIRTYLENEILNLDNKPQSVTPKAAKPQKWTGSKVALVELIYALHAEGVIGNGRAELKEIANLFEWAFGIDLGQFNRVFLEIRARKIERTKFLNTLREKLIVRMDEADEY